MRIFLRLLCLCNALGLCLTASVAARAEAAAQPSATTDLATSNRSLPSQSSAELAAQAQGLVSDVKRIVAAEESFGWVVNYVELDDMYPTLLKSVCRASKAARMSASAILREAVNQTGDAEALFVSDGSRVTTRVQRALTVHRRFVALEFALKSATRDCPFWIAVEPGFEGLQTDRNRFTLNVESGGVAILRRTAGLWTLGAGGFGRVLPAWGFGGAWSLLAGPEFGGGALLRPATGVAVNYFAAVPIIGRLRDVAWHYDIEAAPVALFQNDDTRVSFGARLGTTIGFSALYTTGVIPWAGVSLAYEYYFESGGRPVAHFVRGGFRAGVSWDP